MNILILAAGEGKRFREAGYEMPKPLIDVNGKPMIQRVYESLGLEGRVTIVIQQKHSRLFMDAIARGDINIPGLNLLTVDKLTEGAACTALLARAFIDNDEDLLIVNSDQLIGWSPEDFQKYIVKGTNKHCILTFSEIIEPRQKWSYAIIDSKWQNVVCVVEKQVLSKYPTVGIYYFRRGIDFVYAAETMIKRGIMHNYEYYLCAVYNLLIERGDEVTFYDVSMMESLGEPQDLIRYLESNV